MGRISESVKVLLIINILFFVGTMSLGMKAYDLFALHYPQNENFEYWQLVTHMFMHGGVGHIFLNMFMLYMFGSHLEFSLGRQKFLFLYFSAGFGAAALQLLFIYIGYQNAYQTILETGATPEQIQNTLTMITSSGRYYPMEGVSTEIIGELYTNYVSTMVGASGAIFGVLAAFAVLYPNLPLFLMFIPVPIKAKYLIGAYFALNVYSAITGTSIAGPSNTAYWAHIGGAVFGFFIMWYWKKNSFNKNRWY
ncbi:MAG: rhomboid family intramembrane serine protease [Bacteroidetes bacterium HGW-Bacteroidetes-2]|nr:MAG: rhomboid family intramembrane serine protease [Bacteroidetes bacterium HGW-Bacteroidetes-2]